MYSPLLRRIGAASLCVLAACQSERAVAPAEEAAVSAVAPATASLSTALTGTSISLAVPDTVQLTVRNTTIKRSRTISWRSSNAAVAGVTSAGQVYARAAGTATITASASGRSETTPVFVINQVVTLATNPASLSLSLGARGTIVASSSTASGTMLRYRSYGFSSKNPAVASVDAEGTVTAAASGATEIVVTDGTNSTTVPVSVAGGSADAASVVDFQLTPPSVSLAKGAKRQFATQTIWSDGVSRPVAVTYTATGGTITVGGMYTAGQVVGTFAVIATCACGRADTSLVSVTSVSGQQPTLSSLVMTPSAVTLAPSVQQQFNVTALWSDGGTNLPTLIYTASGGTVRSDGLYTAPAVAGTYRLIVSGGGKADTSAITVVSATPTLSSLTISPKTLSLAPGGSHQFSATALWSNGGTTLPAVTYTALGGGSIAEGDWFNAPTTAGTYRVVVNGGGKADTATVTVTSASSTLTSLQISPSAVTLAPSATYQFSTTALWSNGSTALPTRTYTATGGSVNATGLYTAPGSAGTYKVIVASGAKADTSVVTVSSTAPAPTLTSLSITPSSVTLAPSATLQFSVSALWSNGSTTVPAVLYSANGGSVSATGGYSAPATTGTYRVIVHDASGAFADTSSVTVTASSPPGGGNGLVAHDDFSGYASTAEFQSALSARTLYTDVINPNLVSIDPNVTFNGSKTLMYTFPGASSAAPQLTADIQPTGNMWLRVTVRWSPGFTTTGELNGVVTAANPTGSATSNAYKFLFFSYNEYDGRSGIELTNTNDYLSYIGYKVRNGPDINAFSTPTWSKVKTEWSDGQWYDYIIHYEVTGPQTARMKFWVGKVGTTPVLLQSSSLSGTYAQYPVPKAARILFGRNFNQLRLPNQLLHLWIGRWEVYDGAVNPAPFGF